MAMNSYVDEPLDVMCEGLFDNIEDFLDFPIDDHDDVLRMVESGTNGDSLPPKSASVLSASSGEGSRVTATSEEDKICDDINIPEDWFSKFLDDTDFNIDFPAATTIAAVNNDYKNKDDSLFQSFSPISVLEPNNLSGGGGGSFSSSSSSSSSISVSNDGDTSLAPPEPTMLVVPARARTKRPRPASFSPRSHVTLPFLPPSSDGAATLLESESFSESSCTPPMKKKKKKSINTADTIREEPVAIRKCMHCEIQKTPQWRAGPMGPKTLCNACGVRYKSGRLFPEYRPAASPTFVPTVHSNSHKKVVEMRIKASQKAPTGMPSPECPAAKSCDLLEYIRRKE